MIVVDSSALIAILTGEPLGPACLAVMEHSELIMSAATLTEALIVSIARGRDQALVGLIEAADIEMVSHSAQLAYLSGEAFRQWGKGRHFASLNYGDCCAYALAKNRDCPLLFVGNDFSRTDILSVL
ncbi:MAG: type II toxin-antitoxin system VapC family toxin [Devosia sp.]